MWFFPCVSSLMELWNAILKIFNYMKRNVSPLLGRIYKAIYKGYRSGLIKALPLIKHWQCIH